MKDPSTYLVPFTQAAYGCRSEWGPDAVTALAPADVIIVVGANPTEGHPVFASQMKRRLRQGARLIVVDPREIGLVRSPHIQADYHLRVRPGANVALFNAMAHVIVTEGLTKEDYVAERCEADAYRKWRAFVAEERNSPEATASRRRDLMVTDSSRRRITRTSAYAAPSADAVSRARSVRSRIAGQGSRDRLGGCAAGA